METPEWLARRGASVAKGPNGKMWYVVLGNKPQYRLTPTPAKGRFGCSIVQTNNGRRIASESITDSEVAAIQAGLEDLGTALGWR